MSFRGSIEHLSCNIESNSDSDSDSHNSLNLNTNNNLRSRSRSPLNRLVNMANPSEQRQIPILKKEYIDMVPDFHGETELLPRFLEISEKLVKRFYNAENVDDFQNEYLMSSILAKLKGEVAVNISSCVISNWNDLKNALINSYADKRDCFSLNIEMTEMKQTANESPFDFYNRIQHVLNLQISYLSTHTTADAAKVLIEYFRNYALRILLRGLREPVGSLMRTKNPEDLNSALNMLTNDFQLEITQQKSTNTPKINNKSNFNNKTPYKNSQQNLHTRFNPQFQHYKQNYNPQFQNRTITNNNSSQPNTNNVFRPNNTKQNYPKPTPMSVSTNHTYRPLVYNQQTNNPTRRRQNYVSEELFNIDEPSTSSNTTPNPVDIDEDNDFLLEGASDMFNNSN